MRITKFISFALITIISACGKDNIFPSEEFVERKDIQLTRSQLDYVKQGNNKFALTLFKEIASNNDGRGFVISPLSVTFGLGMVDNGADGNTRKEINKTLSYNEDSVEELNDFCKQMLKQTLEIDPSSTIKFANYAIFNSDYEASPKTSFTQCLQTYYDAKYAFRAFSKENMAKLINAWCKEKTEGYIVSLLKDNDVSNKDYTHFLNAIYFKGIWTSQFNKKDSSKKVFTTEDGSQIKVNMMHQHQNHLAADIPGLCKSVSLPFGNKAFNMVFILPDQSLDMPQFTSILDSELWGKILQQHKYEVDVQVPSFQCEYYCNLNKILYQMGIHDAFNATTANFSRITTAMQINIGKVHHKAKISVDEVGSEAAAVTDVVIQGFTGIQSTPQLFVFNADRPFIYAITEVSTGAILFIGQFTGKDS